MSFRFIVLLLSLLINFGSGANSRITFVDQRYREIVVAIHQDAPINLCPAIIGNVTKIFGEAGTLLYSATNERASFGSINILLPYNWGEEDCDLEPGVIATAKSFQAYEDADFKVSLTHPIGKSLPWTKQYKGCENDSETVYLPLDFLMSSTFVPDVRGRLLVHEWTKFRYGVFEEFGFFDDQYFSPCYTRGGNQHFTTCTNTNILPIGSEQGEINSTMCRNLVSQNTENLRTQLRAANSSILFAPHFDNVKMMNSLCTNRTHNGLAPTRQNVFCERKSINEVIFSHRDFKASAGVKKRLFPNTRSPRPGSPPTVNYIKQRRDQDPGYVFIIEDTTIIREFGRLDHVKQAMAQVLHLASDRTEIAFYQYNGLFNTTIGEIQRLSADDYYRKEILKKVPDRSSPLPSVVQFSKTIETVLEELERLEVNVRWKNIFLITSSPPVPDIMRLTSKFGYPLSVLTFETSKEWLKFYSVPSTREIIFLPHCFKNNVICHGKTSSIISDHLLHLITSDVQPAGYPQKVMDLNLKTVTGDFQLENLVAGVGNFMLHLPVYSDGVSITVSPPNRPGCSSSAVLEYNRLLEIQNTNCPYMAGSWRYEIVGHPQGVAFNYNLRGYVQTNRIEGSLIFSTAMGQNLELEFLPTMIRFPVYISVMSRQEQPIIGATVELVVDYQGVSFDSSNTTIMFDDGIDPDLTADDGIYSTFLTTFNTIPSYHTVQARVQTIPTQSKAITSLRSDTYEAALLDSRMSSKCCGSKIPYDNTNLIDMGYSYYTLTLPSFKTGEGIDPGRNFIPPSKIYSQITLIEDTENYLAYKFTAPGADNNVGRVDHYDICCTDSISGNLDDRMCHPIATATCLPVDAGSEQKCEIYRSGLIADFYNGQTPSTSTTLFCAFRGVDDSENNGPYSSFLVDILVTAGDTKATCKSISDDCLPIEIFWGLIACVGALLLILIIVLICWCCLRRRANKKPDTKSSEDINSSEARNSTTQEPLRNVYINQAYIQDSNGQLKLVASDGQLFPTPVTPERVFNEGSTTPAPNIPRRSLSTADINRQFPSNNYPPVNNSIPKQVSWSADPIEQDNRDKDMPVFFSPRPNHNNPIAVLRPPPTEPEVHLSYSRNPEHFDLDQQRRNTTSPPWENNQAQSQADNFNRGRGNTSSHPAPVRSSEPPIYASVQRFGRQPRKVEPSVFNPPPPINQPSGTRGTGQFSPGYASATKPFSRPENSGKLSGGRVSPIGLAAKPEGYSQDYSIRSRPPVRMDHFPSSESEAYSDMSHILPRLAVIMNQPPIPPPVPTSAAPSRNTGASFPSTSAAPSRNTAVSFPPTPMARAPSRETPAGARTPEMSRPKTFPPPPPPPRQFRNNPNAEEDDEYDDDSDNWDNYDDQFEFTPPGTSYA